MKRIYYAVRRNYRTIIRYSVIGTSAMVPFPGVLPATIYVDHKIRKILRLRANARIKRAKALEKDVQ